MLREAREVFDRMLERNVVIWTVMVKAYTDHGHLQEAVELFDRMPQRNPYSWSAMISGFLRAGKVDEAVRLFERMPDRNVVSWTTMVTGLAQNGRVSMVREFFDRMPRNKDIAAWNAMITAYANAGQMNKAQRLFDSMPAKDLVSWSAIIHGYAKNKHKGEVMRLFLLMLRSAVSPDGTTLISVLVASESTVEVGQIHGFATTRGLLSDTSLGNALLTMYSRSGDLHSAWQVFNMLQEKDPVTWTSMMRAFANHGRASYALQACAQMLQHGYKPSSTTFIAALSACSHASVVDKGRASRAHCRVSVQGGTLYEQWWGKLFQSLTVPLVRVWEATTRFW
uniref:Pentacotripeptide-repeat region of PRORP domain-containing protein n=1 Tax=Triticum aestivum TaxID=4565 RepID=A0A3B6I2P9_WHEAT